MSLLQQLLEEGSEGFFVYGCLKWSTLAPDVRERVRGRLRSIHPMRPPFTAVACRPAVVGVRRLFGIPFKRSPAPNDLLSQLFPYALPRRPFEFLKLQGPTLRFQRVKIPMSLRVQLLPPPYRILMVYLHLADYKFKPMALYGNSGVASVASAGLLGHHRTYPVTQGAFMLKSYQYR